MGKVRLGSTILVYSPLWTTLDYVWQPYCLGDIRDRDRTDIQIFGRRWESSMNKILKGWC